MSNFNLLGFYLHLFLFSLPVLIVCFGASVIVLVRWKSHPARSLWALLGFGLGLIIALAQPITQTAIQAWLIKSGNIASHAWVFSVMGFFWSVLRACAYLLLFVAVLAERE